MFDRNYPDYWVSELKLSRGLSPGLIFSRFPGFVFAVVLDWLNDKYPQGLSHLSRRLFLPGITPQISPYLLPSKITELKRIKKHRKI